MDDVTADKLQARLVSGHTHRALRAGHVSARDLCHRAVQYTDYFEYSNNISTTVILHHFTHSYNDNICSIKYRKGLSIIYLSWTINYLVKFYVIHNFTLDLNRTVSAQL